ENLEEALEEANVFSSVQTIFSSYVELADDGNLEALKRALFYAWYEKAEPHVFSGMKFLDTESSERVLKLVGQYFELEANPDDEILAMFSHYQLITDWYFENLNTFPTPEKLSKSSYSKIKSVDERGLMGRYWESILKT
ncbi:MAG: hypothetical protein AAGD96_34150, partial [Chloroflexota bacterium]